MKKNKWIFLLLLVSSLISLKVFSDEDEWEEHEGRREHEGKFRSYGPERDEGRRTLMPMVLNTKYKMECTSCHMAYPPNLLPSRSWEKMMGSLDKHFGEDASLDEKVRKEIQDYLVKNSADGAPSRRSSKMLNGINASDVPLRISETEYFKRKHHELSDKVFKRKAIGSKANCIACHQGAESGNFDEDNVRIPKENEPVKKVSK